jgi:FkbM family methyltransferase
MKILFFFHCFLAVISISVSKIAAEVSYSSFDSMGIRLDQKLVELMSYENGVFIEVGANDGIQQSNTRRFEEFHGWTGILVEPSEILFSKLRNNRPNSKCFQCALGSFEENNTFADGDFDGSLMSSIDGERLQRSALNQVLIRSLQSILDETDVQHVNFFSLDTEGYELNILKGIDFSRITFDYMLIEIYQHQYESIVSFLQKRGYEMIENFSNYNKINNPGWDGSHNDYLFKNITLKNNSTFLYRNQTDKAL